MGVLFGRLEVSSKAGRVDWVALVVGIAAVAVAVLPENEDRRSYVLEVASANRQFDQVPIDLYIAACHMKPWVIHIVDYWQNVMEVLLRNDQSPTETDQDQSRPTGCSQDRSLIIGHFQCHPD